MFALCRGNKTPGSKISKKPATPKAPKCRLGNVMGYTLKLIKKKGFFTKQNFTCKIMNSVKEKFSGVQQGHQTEILPGQDHIRINGTRPVLFIVQ